MKAHYVCIGIAAVAIFGCGKAEKPASGPVAGTLKLEGLTLDEQIEKVKNDPSIPDQYKQTAIRSLEDKKRAGLTN